MSVTIGVNGFGRIGRQLVRAALECPTVTIAAINDPFLDTDAIAYGLKYDTTAGRFSGVVEVKSKGLLAVDGRAIRTFHQSDPSLIPWAELNVSVVVDCSGVFTTAERAAAHMGGGAPRVLIAGASADAPIIIMGCNEDTFKASATQVVSASSCTAVALAPFLQLLHTTYGVTECAFTAIQSATSGHRMVDGAVAGQRDPRAGRGAADNITPMPNLAPRQLQRILPWTTGRVFGTSIRVPTSNVSLLDITVQLENAVSKVALDQLIISQTREGSRLHGVLGYSDEPLVSSDYLLDAHAGVYDSLASMALVPPPTSQDQASGLLSQSATNATNTQQLPARHFKVFLWYNNERGYAKRLLDIASRMAAAGH